MNIIQIDSNGVHEGRKAITVHLDCHMGERAVLDESGEVLEYMASDRWFRAKKEVLE